MSARPERVLPPAPATQDFRDPPDPLLSPMEVSDLLGAGQQNAPADARVVENLGGIYLGVLAGSAMWALIGTVAWLVWAGA